MQDKPTILGILNVTPDSFSGDGIYKETNDAVCHAIEMHKDGANLIDVGGVSTRPGADPVSLEEELSRVLPVVQQLSEEGVAISLDTSSPEVVRQCADYNVTLINCQFASDQMMNVAAEYCIPLVIMHTRGNPRTMNKLTTYEDIVNDVKRYFIENISRAKEYGVGSLVLDPGIGFAKTSDQNWTLLNKLGSFTDLGHPLLVGASRKKFVRDEGLRGTLLAHLCALKNGAQYIRVHDVKEHVAILYQMDSLFEEG